jgi:NitT/TauT family transport system substrate-binding protein
MISRRELLRGFALAGTTGLLSLRPEPVAAEPPPETTRLRVIDTPGACLGPALVAEDLLRAEGFSNVEYLKLPGALAARKALASGDGQFFVGAVPLAVSRIDAGDPIVVLAGIHVGCYELFGNDRVRAIRDLRGRSVGVTDLGSSRHLLVAAMAALVGLDAFIGFPPEPQELRARKIGHVVVDTGADRPWSQYFCCMVTGNREFVRRHPIATKRALRAFLKATDICAVEPERVARLLVDRAYAPDYTYALQTVKEISYSRWREFDAADTVRFYALRLHEAGLIQSSPQKILAQGTDWRFLTELKKELKG